MRARNREINIFNMSLLDILTGMLGAFLFLMLGLLPYYSKVAKGKQIDPEELRRLREENQRLQNMQQPQDVSALRKQIEDLASQRDYWRAQQGTVSFVTTWDSAAADIDVLVMKPSGKIVTPKPNDKVLGRNADFDGAFTSGPAPTLNQQGLLLFLEKAGDYLVFYRVPKGTQPAAYANLRGWFIYNEGLGEKKGVMIVENSLGDPRAVIAEPGGLYAWAILHYDNEKCTVTARSPEGFKLPKGVTIPKPTPVSTPAPAATVVPPSERR